MALAQQLRDDLAQAMRQQDKTKTLVLRLALANIHNAEIAQQKTLDEAGIIGVLSRESKQRRESIEAFEKGNRQDLVDKEKAELTIILGYLPEQLSRDDIVAAARKVISEIGARGPGDKGKVMSKLMPEMKGKAEGQAVSAIVAELLSNI